MEILGLVGLILLFGLAAVVVGVISLLVYLSCSMFRSAGQVDIKEDYVPPELAGAQNKLERATLNLEVLEELPGAEFVLQDAANDVEKARADVADAAQRSRSSARRRAVRRAS